MANANTEHSKKLRAESARNSLKKAMEEGKIKRKLLQAPTHVIEEFINHMAATGGKNDAEKLERINRKLRELDT